MGSPRHSPSRWFGAVLLLWVWMSCAQATELLEAHRRVAQGTEVLSEQVVRLPDEIPRAWLDDQIQLSYRWRFEPSAGETRPQALWIFRVGAPYSLLINGAPAHRLLPMPELPPDPASVFNGRSPALFALPTSGAEIELRFQARPFMQFGLIQLHQGPTEALALRHTQEYERVATPVFVNIVLSGTLFRLAALLWIARVKLILLGLFAGLCGAMALRHGLIYQSDIGLPALLYEHMNPYLIACFDLMALAASWKLANVLSQRRQRALIVTWVVFTLVSVVAIAAERHTLLLRGIVQATGLSALLYIVGFTLKARHQLKPSWTWSIALGYLALLLGALHDLGLTSTFTPTTHGTMIVWGFGAVVLAYAFVTADFVLRELQRSLQAGVELEQRVQEARLQLEKSYAMLAKHEQREAARQERSQIMRELHDGLGAQLVTALRGVERNALSKDEVVQALQDSLGQLRHLLSTQSTEGRLVGALANWREHWQERLAKAGVNIEWSIDDSADDLVLSPDTLHQLLRILQECATNTLKHSRADRFAVSVRVCDGTLLLRIRDNGQGFESPPPGNQGQGLQGMAARAQQIGAALRRDNGPSPWGACIEVALPLQG